MKKKIDFTQMFEVVEAPISDLTKDQVGEVDGPTFECVVCNHTYLDPADAAECEDRCWIEEQQYQEDVIAYEEFMRGQDGVRR